MVNHKRVARVMRESLLGPRPQRRRVLSTDMLLDQPHGALTYFGGKPGSSLA